MNDYGVNIDDYNHDYWLKSAEMMPEMSEVMFSIVIRMVLIRVIKAVKEQLIEFIMQHLNMMKISMA